MPVIVFNPLNWRRREMAVGSIDFDFDDPTADNFQLVDHNGQTIPCQVLGDEEVFWMETLKANRKRRLKVAFRADVPPCGYTGFFVQPAPGGKTDLAPSNQWSIDDDGAENRYLWFRISPDGGLTLHDKGSDITYTDLHHFEDVEDAGDEYSYCPCENSMTISTRGLPASVNLVKKGVNLATFEVRWRLHIPASLSADRKSRSNERVPLSITTQISIYRDQPGLYIETEIDNQACDHKFSVTFPTALVTSQSFVDQAFIVMPRDIDLPDSTGWLEDPTPLMHQRAFIDIHEGGSGLAILNRGLPAVEVIRKKPGTQISLVLLRSVGWLSRDDLTNRRIPAGPLVPTPGAQCIGLYKYNYAILPHTGHWEQVYPWAYQYVSPLLVSRADTHEGLDLREMNITRDDPTMVKAVAWPRSGSNPGNLSYITINEPEIVISALRRSQDGKGLIVRFYNITADPVSAQVKSYRSLSDVWAVNLNEERQDRIHTLDSNAFEVKVGGHQIATYELRLAAF
jgi:alpha-mannosidase